MQKTEKFDKSLDFSYVSRETLKEIADFEFAVGHSIFYEWFNYPHIINDNELFFLDNLIEEHIFDLKYYSELQLFIQFISPLFNEINFVSEESGSWYKTELSGILNSYKLKGKLDFLIAKGKTTHEPPYIFVQKIETSFIYVDPLIPLLLEMAVIIEKNTDNIMRGAYNTGAIWTFIILEKTDNNKYKYYKSEEFSCLEIDELKQIYINLQAVKSLYHK